MFRTTISHDDHLYLDGRVFQQARMRPDGYREVTKDEFFAAIGPRDVHPVFERDWFDSWYRRTYGQTAWNLRFGGTVGVSYDSKFYPRKPTRYFVKEAA